MTSQTGTGATILIVDDEAPIRNVLEERLTHEGFAVISADNGATGLTYAQTFKPDLILIDIRMKEMSGYEMLKRLRAMDAWSQHVPAIFLTNIQIEGDVESSGIEETEPAHYLIKSDTSLDELVEKIRETLKKAKA